LKDNCFEQAKGSEGFSSAVKIACSAVGECVAQSEPMPNRFSAKEDPPSEANSLKATSHRTACMGPVLVAQSHPSIQVVAEKLSEAEFGARSESGEAEPLAKA
jgi:hypothetical protein